MTNKIDCFGVDGGEGMQIEAQSMLPDISDFELLGEELKSGQNCQKWQKVQKVNEYWGISSTIYVSLRLVRRWTSTQSGWGCLRTRRCRSTTRWRGSTPWWEATTTTTFSPIKTSAQRSLLMKVFSLDLTNQKTAVKTKTKTVTMTKTLPFLLSKPQSREACRWRSHVWLPVLM